MPDRTFGTPTAAADRCGLRLTATVEASPVGTLIGAAVDVIDDASLQMSWPLLAGMRLARG